LYVFTSHSFIKFEKILLLRAVKKIFLELSNQEIILFCKKNYGSLDIAVDSEMKIPHHLDIYARKECNFTTLDWTYLIGNYYREKFTDIFFLHSFGTTCHSAENVFYMSAPL